MRDSWAHIDRRWLELIVAALTLWGLQVQLLAAEAADPKNEIRIIELQNNVEVMAMGASRWMHTQTNELLYPGDRIRTGNNSRVTLQWCDESVVPFGALTEIEIIPTDNSDSLPGLHLLKGVLSFFHREKPGRIRVITRGANASIEGTELVVEVAPAGDTERTTLSVIDGAVNLSNANGALRLTNGEQAVVENHQAPQRTAGFIANNILQWCFYYPAVLDLDDLKLTSAEEQALQASLEAYRAGDLLAALAAFPEGRLAGSQSERLYHAALLLSVGQVAETEAELAQLNTAPASDRISRLAGALRTLIAAVKRQSLPAEVKPPAANDSPLATELLAASYLEQSRAQGEASLKPALDLARQAAGRSGRFGFAWSRVAELEFGFGRVASATKALDKSLELSPRNSQALALKGFLLAAANRVAAALGWFNRAIGIDAALGNAWLGRGLCRIRQGDTQGGRRDLLVAAALEPQRGLLRSYLGKAYANAGKMKRADHELALALGLDPGDPTGWLYSALLKQQQNRVNEAVADLENSQALNDNRRLFRSRLMLDEDRAVRSANLASIYRDAGMTEVSVREAAHAVSYDYANDSAHLFLAESYDALRDPTRFNLRYETVWFNELLLANLLAPVGGGRLAQHVSQQEYSKLLQADGLGIANSTIARSDGSFTQLTSQYGAFGRTSYALDVDYQHNDGIRPNNDLDSLEWYTTIKQQVTENDTALALIKYEDYHSGDNFQYYSPNQARPHFRFDESQEPIAVGGWHHEWAPGMHTLVLGGRLINEQKFSDLKTPQLLLFHDAFGRTTADFEPFDANYRGQLEIYTVEANQIFQWNRLTISTGGRYQAGDFDTQMIFTNPPALVPFLFPHRADAASVHAEFERITGYGYVTLEPIDRVWLTGGLAYEDMTFPRNFRNPPLTAGEDHRSQWGPKACALWQPLPEVAVRGVFARSLGGVSLDESYRLEPTQLAGFPQTFRTLMPESVVGSVAAPEYEVFGGALDLKLSGTTYAGVEAQQLHSTVRRTIGVFSLFNSQPPYVADATEEHLDCRENVVKVSFNQLLGEGFAAGASYQVDQMELNDTLPAVHTAGLASLPQRALLHQVSAYVLLNHRSGFFARVDATWYHQHNSGYEPALPGDSFFQENLFTGYRFLNRRMEVQLGILNLSGQDYHLNPLNVYAELPRERIYTARLNFIF